MTDITNTHRAAWATAALATFVELTGPDDDASAIADLIADLGHLCDERELDFIDIIARGIGHWRAETAYSSDANRIDIMPAISIGEVVR